MSVSSKAGTGAAPVERFKPTSGQFPGWAGLLVAAVAVVWPAFEEHTVTGLRVAAGALFAGTLVWATQLRPRATAYRDRLVLRNAVRDSHIPLHLVDEVAMRTSLVVYAADERYICIGIGQSVREELRTRRRRNRQSSNLGTSRWRDFEEMAERPALDQTATSYQTFVATRIQELADEARRAPHPETAGTTVERRWAWPELALMVVTGLAFVATFLV